MYRQHTPKSDSIRQQKWQITRFSHEVRLTGNDAAHPPKDVSTDEAVLCEDAEDILTLIEKFIDVLYIAPALAKERRQRRNATLSS